MVRADGVVYWVWKTFCEIKFEYGSGREILRSIESLEIHARINDSLKI